MIVFDSLADRENPATERRSREKAPPLDVVREVPSLKAIDDSHWRRVKMRQENWRAGD